MQDKRKFCGECFNSVLLYCMLKGSARIVDPVNSQFPKCDDFEFCDVTDRDCTSTDKGRLKLAAREPTQQTGIVLPRCIWRIWWRSCHGNSWYRSADRCEGGTSWSRLSCYTRCIWSTPRATALTRIDTSSLLFQHPPPTPSVTDDRL